MNLQFFATEIYKVRYDLGAKIMKDIFHCVEKSYNLRYDSVLQRRRNCTVYPGAESIPSFVPKMWEIVRCEIKIAKSLDVFKEKIKLWTTNKCLCRLCERYIGNVGFV